MPDQSHSTNPSSVMAYAVCSCDGPLPASISPDRTLAENIAVRLRKDFGTRYYVRRVRISIEGE